MSEARSIESTDDTRKESEDLASPIPSPTPDEIGLLREIVFVGLVVGTQLLTQASLAQTIITVGTLSKDFDVTDSPGEQSWFTAAFSLTVGTFILISGRLGDLFGYKKIFVSAYCFLSLSSLITGFTVYTHSVVFFDVMRSLQGLGFSLAFPNALAIFGHYYPMGPKRILFMCLFGAVAPGGFVIGSLFNTTIVNHAWWPWGFWVLAIVALVVAFTSFFVIPKNIVNNSSHRGGFDWVGSVTGVCGLILINFAFNQGPNVGWDKPYVYVLLIVGFLFVGAFFVVERKVKNPLVPKEVMRGETGFVLGCIAAGWSSFGIWLFYTARFLSVLDLLSPMQVTVRYITVLPMGIAAAGLTAVLLPKINVSYIMIIAMTAFLVCNVLIGNRPVGQVYWAQNFVSFLIGPFGMDMSFPAATVILSHSFPKHQQGVAASLVSTIVNYSISIGLGLAGTVEYYTVKGQPDTFEVTERGIRRAFYMGMGLGGLGVVTAIVFIFYERAKDKRKEKASSDAKEHS
ncbi:hypothetical protein PSN45_004397 [Yamadazyma tenuis]|uniref:Major facilitator superfamily (MFS) profile domain-containing protein n=1 Tax=Candida tenuis (strain ATCC 10573 / BCRC 21748 / CBS 615 / JCM 9827 / NBRC 10315 / NRRL Y-1498 / VKM Y-70) TaxID=590646 RepID=G3B5X6_CANTC|nr:uncharacterized protein CANTEDRAFT_130813 [Yamadazyma tenuis ATCC 10573]EGV63327.1 hypothetical protein CANTEDRAFT_130813 [Yamadazyma tenuis ATCC 10573]WEJ96852.1 hypothetical protein PSN45_004397 [Yamadazyma tenuis]